jgi:hypothetical protein
MAVCHSQSAGPAINTTGINVFAPTAGTENAVP